MKKQFTRLARPQWLGAFSACMLTSALWLSPMEANAQLSSNPDKFLGNITTYGSVDSGSEKYYTLWNQITAENESKWASIEGTRDRYNWGGSDNAYNYAKEHGFPFKFHTLIWGSQYPGWMDNLSTKEQYEEIVEWMDEVKKRYPDLPMIDVVNEAVPGHNPAPFKEALGGDGVTGYDWIIKAFELAYERWPDAILIYNDFNTFQWQRTEFINLVKTLRDAGAPVDAYGCQSHDVTDLSLSNFKTYMKEIQTALKMPMYSTEYDVGTTDDNLQLQRYKEQIPYMWESDYCAGITLWGYIYGKTWIEDKNTGEKGISGIIKNGKDRPAMTWLREYMQTDAAKNAKSPFPGMVKEASVYIKPSNIRGTKGEPLPVTIRASMKTKTIDHIDLYLKGNYYCTLTEAPYVVDVVATSLGRQELKAVVVTTDSTKYERIGAFTAYNPRAPFKGAIELPGTLQIENFDSGAEGVSYHDTDTKNEGGTSYRNNGGGVDIVMRDNGYVVGYTKKGEWLEYTVNVTKAGLYSFDATASSGVTNSSFNLSLKKGEEFIPLIDNIVVPCVQANNWDKYKTVHGRLLVNLEEGEQIFRITVTGAECNMDKIVFKHVEMDENMQVSISANPNPAEVGSATTLMVDASSETSTIASVRIYVDDMLVKNVTTAPFEALYMPSATGVYNVKAVAVDAEEKHSQVATYELRVNNKRTAYKGTTSLPGTLEAENFDQGGEGFTYHDKDEKDDGGTNYRTDKCGVDIFTCTGGYAVGNTVNNEWLEYTVNVVDPGLYSYEATVSSIATGSNFNIGVVKDGVVTNLCKVTVPNTGNKNSYKTVTGTFTANLDSGEQIIRITINGGYCNIDKIELKCIQINGINGVLLDNEPEGGVMYNLFGVRVDENYKGIVIKNGRKMLNR